MKSIQPNSISLISVADKLHAKIRMVTQALLLSDDWISIGNTYCSEYNEEAPDGAHEDLYCVVAILLTLQAMVCVSLLLGISK